jgi:hypothetical protein
MEKLSLVFISDANVNINCYHNLILIKITVLNILSTQGNFILIPYR